MHEVIGEITEYLSIFPSVEKIILFGSRARGDNRARSDFDIAVLGKVPQEDRADIDYFLKEEANTLLKIDCVYVDNLDKESSIFASIQREGVTLYERKYLENLKNAVKRLNEAKTAYTNEIENSLYRDALIQRFEFSLELAWKTIREMLISDFFPEKELNSPRHVIAKAYQENYIDDETIWLDMLKERNNIAHIYSEEDSIIVAEKIKMKFCKVLTNLLKTVK